MTEDKDPPPAEHLKGSVKEDLGKLTGDARIEAEGWRQKRGAPAPKAGKPKPGGSDRV